MLTQRAQLVLIAKYCYVRTQQYIWYSSTIPAGKNKMEIISASIVDKDGMVD